MNTDWTYDAVIVRVVDGDTVDAVVQLGFDIQHTIRLRLDGINTPESYGPDKEPAGDVAKKYLDKRLKKSNYKCVIVTGKTEKFGRYLAELFVNGISINKELIEKGYAKEYHGERRI